MCQHCGQDITATQTLSGGIRVTVALTDYGDRLDGEHGYWYRWSVVCHDGNREVRRTDGPKGGYFSCAREAWENARPSLNSLLAKEGWIDTPEDEEIIDALEDALFAPAAGA